MNTLIYNIGRLVTNKGVVEKDGIGITTADLTVIDDAEVFIENGRIRFVGPKEMIVGINPDYFVDAKKGVMIPALVDPHTHAIFAGSRHDEFEKRAEGQSYLEIAKQGGGIQATVAKVRKASVEQLVEQALPRILRLNGFGAGVVEIKSGYGLSVESELKMLEAVKALQAKTSTDLVPTFMGGHAIAPEFKDEPDRYVDLIVNEMIPAVARKKLASFCDVFAEKGFFSIDQARRILLAAKDHGMAPKLHADEFEPLGGAQLAAEVGAISADHLLAVDDDGIKALAQAGTTAVLLPGTSLYLGEGRYAPARKMIDSGCRVALASDLNPGSCYSENLSLIMTLACVNLKMTVAETIAAATYNAAKAIGMEGSHGAILPGKVASLALFATADYSAIPYHMAVSDLSDLWIGGERVIGQGGDSVADLRQELAKNPD